MVHDFFCIGTLFPFFFLYFFSPVCNMVMFVLSCLCPDVIISVGGGAAEQAHVPATIDSLYLFILVKIGGLWISKQVLAGEFRAHRAVLCHRSEYFRAMLSWSPDDRPEMDDEDVVITIGDSEAPKSIRFD